MIINFLPPLAIVDHSIRRGGNGVGRERERERENIKFFLRCSIDSEKTNILVIGQLSTEQLINLSGPFNLETSDRASNSSDRVFLIFQFFRRNSAISSLSPSTCRFAGESPSFARKFRRETDSPKMIKCRDSLPAEKFGADEAQPVVWNV